MALSKDYIRPYLPHDVHTVVTTKRAAAAATFTPGTVVVESGGLVVECDLDTALHGTLPAYITWTDLANRRDINVYNLDGSQEKMVECFALDFKADVATSCFTATPVAGDLIVRSQTAGKLSPVTEAEFAAAPYSGNTRLLLGRVEGASHRGDSGFWACTFGLGR